MLFKKNKNYFSLFLGFLICVCVVKIDFNCIYAIKYKDVKISVVGETNAGKTAVIDYLRGEKQRVEEFYNQDISFSCEFKDVVGNLNLENQYIADSNFIVITIDAANDCEYFMEKNIVGLMKNIKDKNPNANVIWFFTKIDLLGQDRRQELENNIALWRDLYRDRVSTLFVSVRTGENMDQFFEIIKRVAREKNLLDSLLDYNPQDVNKKNEEGKIGCFIL